MRAIPPLALVLLAALAGCGDEPTLPAEPYIEDTPILELQNAEAARLGVPVMFGPPSMAFAFVPAGSFGMGSPRREAGRRDDETYHAVHMRVPFYIQTEAVRNGQLRDWLPGFAQDADDDEPATGVSHDHAVAFAAWLTERDPSHRYRLPTEAEWEYAIKGLPMFRGATAEWCHDWYAPYPDWPVQNYAGPNVGTKRVVRGWRDEDALPRASRRHALEPDNKDAGVGFRLVAEVGYGSKEFGSVAVTIESRVRDMEGVDGERKDGYRVRIISILDRLADRQAGGEEEWSDLEGETPLSLKMIPARYYLYVYRKDGDGEDGDGEVRGREEKIDVRGEALTITLPIPTEDAP